MCAKYKNVLDNCVSRNHCIVNFPKLPKEQDRAATQRMCYFEL